VAPERARTEDLGELAVVVTGRVGPVTEDVGAAAATIGVPVHDAGAQGVEAAIGTSAAGRVPTAWTAGVEQGAAELVAELLATDPAAP
jgi:hypothetical protein